MATIRIRVDIDEAAMREQSVQLAADIQAALSRYIAGVFKTATVGLTEIAGAMFESPAYLDARRLKFTCMTQSPDKFEFVGCSPDMFEHVTSAMNEQRRVMVSLLCGGALCSWSGRIRCTTRNETNVFAFEVVDLHREADK